MNTKLTTEVLTMYTDVIKAFKNRADVQSGNRLGYRNNQDPNGVLLLKNKPHSIGEGLTTTGYCVSASQSLLYDKAFQALLSYRGAQAKLISIDIKEQYWGQCYNGSRNTWHTAILVNDEGINFVIDLTCAQFGNRFVESFIWYFDTWQKTFRSPICKHKIIDFSGNELGYNLLPGYENERDEGSIQGFDSGREEFRQRLAKEVNLNQGEIDFLAEFFYKKMKDINLKLVNGVLNKFDSQYIDTLTRCILKLDIIEVDKPYYHVMSFKDKASMVKFLKNFQRGAYIINTFMTCYNDLEKAINKCPNCYRFNSNDMHDNDLHYVVFQFESPIDVIDTVSVEEGTILVPYGTKTNITKEDIFNSIELQSSSILDTRKTNTWYVKI